MKKNYIKPQIMFEDFTLSTNIAGDCETKTNNPSNNTCGMTASGLGTVFLDTMSGCSWKVVATDGDGEFNGICYHVPTGDNNLFNS